jgi:hypothetical protein
MHTKHKSTYHSDCCHISNLLPGQQISMDTNINITWHCNSTGTAKRRDDNNLSQTTNAHTRSSTAHELYRRVNSCWIGQDIPQKFFTLIRRRVSQPSSQKHVTGTCLDLDESSLNTSSLLLKLLITVWRKAKTSHTGQKRKKESCRHK